MPHIKTKPYSNRRLIVKHAPRLSQEKTILERTFDWASWYYSSQQDFETVRTYLGVSKTKLNGFLNQEILPKEDVLEKMEGMIDE